MQFIVNFFLKFTGKKHSPLRKILSLIPGIIIFLIVSPFVIFHLSVFLRSFIQIDVVRSIELVIVYLALPSAILLMSWSFWELWTQGNGTPAPIAPTSMLVVTGPYQWCRNPIELGTGMYFLALGVFFDSFITGVFCMVFGLTLGISYIKLIEEKEMLVRFGAAYDKYLNSVPFMALPFFSIGMHPKR